MVADHLKDAEYKLDDWLTGRKVDYINFSFIR